MSSSINVVTPEAIFSYVNIWKARAHRDSPDNLKYGLALVIPKSADITQLQDAYNSVLAADFPEGLPYGARPGGLLDGAVRYPNDPFYADKWILSASQDEDRFNHQNVMDVHRNPIMNKSEIYSGAFGHAHISFYSYKGGTGGIGCSLHGLLKTRDGEALGGEAPNSTDAFAQAGIGGGSTAPQQAAAGAVPPPSAPQQVAPTVPPARVMTPAANGATYEAMIAAGWTDETLIEHGMMIA